VPEREGALLRHADQAAGDGVAPRLLDVDVARHLGLDDLDRLGLGHVHEARRLAGAPGGDDGHPDWGSQRSPPLAKVE
jgi:hypothetical protein